MSKILCLLFAAFITVTALPAHAAESAWAVEDQVRARLVSGPGAEAALEVDLVPGWHAYWRTPGDAGLPPQFDWAKSVNVTGVDIAWPYPQRFDEMGITTFGYTGNTVFPLTMHMIQPGAKTRLSLGLSIMVCRDICIPQSLEVTLEFDAAPGSQNPQIEQAKKKIPGAGDAGLAIDAVVAGPDALVITASSSRELAGADVFAVAGDVALTGKPEVTPDAKDPRKAMIRIPKPAGEADFAGFLAGKELYVVLVSGNQATEKSIKF